MEAHKKFYSFSFIIMALFSLVGLISILIRGPLQSYINTPQLWAESVTDSLYKLSGTALILAYCLPFFGFHALFEVLKSKGVDRWIYWGFFSCIFGTVFTLPMLGFVSFSFPVMGEAFLLNNQETLNLITKIMQGPTLFLSLASGFLYLIGPVFFFIAIRKTNAFSRISALLFGLHGICLSLGFSFFPLLITGWFLLMTSSLLFLIEIKNN